MEKDKQSTNELIIDVTRNYPEKELTLQDFMDVEYIPLKQMMSCYPRQSNGPLVQKLCVTSAGPTTRLFVFDRKTSKALKKINRKGQGGEEYVEYYGVVLDEANKEIFVTSLYRK